ncbi:uncharacterized protein UHOD_11907 [Ustilago sp. UG-2017b]|nr:uncharacterized protein UHOD_11907 [Ustilago sp. UG-2017b]
MVVSITKTCAGTVKYLSYIKVFTAVGRNLPEDSLPAYLTEISRKELTVMGLDAQEAGRSVNSYEGSAGIKESGKSSVRAKLISQTPPRSVVEETMWQIPRRSVARMIVRRIHMRGGPSAAKEGTQLRSMQPVTTQEPQDGDLENHRRSKEEELCQGHRQAGHEEEEQCRSN